MTDDDPYVWTLSRRDAMQKRWFDLVVALLGLALGWWVILIAWALATIDTGDNGIFTQQRVGRDGKSFRVYKVRTMRSSKTINTTVTTRNDPRITKLGGMFRMAKIDELPQLINVAIGQMSLVGPRPDVPGFADQLQGPARSILSIRPGITGPATIKYRNEEQILAMQPDPEAYNREVIFPDKVAINLDYIRNWSFRNDLKYLWYTLVRR